MNLQNIGFNTGQAVGDFLYCSATKFNGLFKINIYTGETIFLGHFPKEDYSGNMLFRESYVYEKNIIFVPENATGIGIYDVELNIFKRVGLENSTICCSCIIENILWMFPIFGEGKIWKSSMCRRWDWKYSGRYIHYK